MTTERKVIDCPNCVKGTVIVKGSMWWQDQHYRCATCKGSGRIYAPDDALVCRQADVREDQP